MFAVFPIWDDCTGWLIPPPPTPNVQNQEVGGKFLAKYSSHRSCGYPMVTKRVTGRNSSPFGTAGGIGVNQNGNKSATVSTRHYPLIFKERSALFRALRHWASHWQCNGFFARVKLRKYMYHFDAYLLSECSAKTRTTRAGAPPFTPALGERVGDICAVPEGSPDSTTAYPAFRA